MNIRGRKAYHFTLDLDSNDRDALAHELICVLGHADYKDALPKLQQLLMVVETVEHGDTRGLDVTSGPEDGL